jgi:hypothetical protein
MPFPFAERKATLVVTLLARIDNNLSLRASIRAYTLSETMPGKGGPLPGRFDPEVTMSEFVRFCPV